MRFQLLLIIVQRDHRLQSLAGSSPLTLWSAEVENVLRLANKVLKEPFNVFLAETTRQMFQYLPHLAP